MLTLFLLIVTSFSADEMIYSIIILVNWTGNTEQFTLYKSSPF